MDRLLNPDTGLMIWTIVTFFSLVVILRLFAWGPMLKAIDDREAAEKARAEAERIQKELEVHMAGIQAKSKELLAAATKDGDALRAKLKAEAEADAAAIKSKTTLELAAEKDKLVGDLRREVMSLSVLAAERLLRKSVDAGVQKSVLDGFFKDLDSNKKAGSN